MGRKIYNNKFNFQRMDFRKVYVIHNDHDVPYHMICKALSMIVSSNEHGQDIVDFGKIIGYSNLVKVDDDEEFYEEYRGKRPYKSRFVKNKLPVPCSKLAVIWQRKNASLIYVITAYFTQNDNPTCPDEPGNIIRKINNGMVITQAQIQESLDFWTKHAFVEPIPMNY